MTSLRLPVDDQDWIRVVLTRNLTTFYSQSHSGLLLLGSRAYRRPDVLGKSPWPPSSSYLLIPIPGSLPKVEGLISINFYQTTCAAKETDSFSGHIHYTTKIHKVHI
jgi:hypothetical protein